MNQNIKSGAELKPEDTESGKLETSKNTVKHIDEVTNGAEKEQIKVKYSSDVIIIRDPAQEKKHRELIIELIEGNNNHPAIIKQLRQSIRLEQEQIKELSQLNYAIIPETSYLSLIDTTA